MGALECNNKCGGDCLKNAKKAFLIFSAALNLVMICAVAFIMMSYRNDLLAEAQKGEAELHAAVTECKNMLSRSVSAYTQEKIADARAFLISAQYVGSQNRSFSELCGAGDYYFFESSNESSGADYAVFVGALDAVLAEREMTEGEREMSEKVMAAYTFSEFESVTYPRISLYADVDEKKAKKIAARALGKNVAIEKCENSHFPLKYTFAGGNTYAALSVQGGKIIELMFYPGEKVSQADEEKARNIMLRFLHDEKFPEMTVDGIVLYDGIYYARLACVKYPSLYVVMAVGGVSGRVCLFDAEAFYSGYGKR